MCCLDVAWRESLQCGVNRECHPGKTRSLNGIPLRPRRSALATDGGVGDVGRVWLRGATARLPVPSPVATGGRVGLPARLDRHTLTPSLLSLQPPYRRANFTCRYEHYVTASACVTVAMAGKSNRDQRWVRQVALVEACGAPCACVRLRCFRGLLSCGEGAPNGQPDEQDEP